MIFWIVKNGEHLHLNCKAISNAGMEIAMSIANFARILRAFPSQL
jgi:hypothetical protein